MTALQFTPTSLTLSWSPPPPEHRNGIITEYMVIVLVLSTLQATGYNTNDTMLALTGLQPYSNYQMRVAASTSAGWGPQTDSLVLQTAQDGKECVDLPNSPILATGLI